MRVRIEIIDETKQEEAVISTYKLTEAVRQAQAVLSDSALTITASIDDKNYIIDTTKIYYIESVDNKTFISCKDNVYETKLKLYELEEILDKSRFLRCSKSMIINIRKIRSVKASVNARFDATLLNDEKIVISRSYVKELKKMLGM